MQIQQPILTSRFRLRSMAEEDLVHKVLWYNDPEIRQSLILDEELRLPDTVQWYKSIKDSPQRLDLLIETHSGDPVGLISLVHIDTKNKTAEVVLVIGNKQCWGKGVMLEVESVLIAWAFSQLGMEKIWAQTRPENIASLITMKKLGFQIEGTLRGDKVIADRRVDIVQLGLLKEEFKSHT